MTVHALFFCLRPDPATALRLSGVSDEIAHRFGLRVRPSRAERLHVTLHHLGWYDDQNDEADTMAEVRRLAEDAADTLRHAPLRLDFDELLSFRRKPRNLPLVLSGGRCLDEVRVLRAALGECLRAAGLRTDPHFTPHLTLFYDNTPIEPGPFIVPGWDAADFHLIDSLQGQSRHVDLGRWALTAAPA
ncbi:MAG: 2'-5' RNA ligase family protein [Mitsuaria chitosanitabida]|uniref:2'-5' RNA ligase family protein n=1 Tax=Roseateles chitosanitabidus TaxID=65048 RepID=UPI001B1F576D|nr:2'-5' RNA ligase family protein [Roseateles chitosanitabidus]MBO9688598.1 2'-5' RNA ligase family protein [Roseateles chitosanitabidus]